MTGHYVGAYWGVRKETSEACAERLKSFLNALSEESKELSTWYYLRNSRVGQPRLWPRDAEAIAKSFRRNKTDFGRDVIPELGYSFSIRNRQRGEFDSMLSGSIGMYSAAVTNVVLLDFHEMSQADIKLLSRLLTAIVESFQPDHAIVRSQAIQLGGPESQPIWEQPSLIKYVRGSGYSFPSSG